MSGISMSFDISVHIPVIYLAYDTCLFKFSHKTHCDSESCYHLRLDPGPGPWHPDIECRTFDIERNIRYRRLRHRMLIDIDDFFIRYRISISNVFDIEGHISRYQRSHSIFSNLSKVTKGNVDIEVSSIRYRTKVLRYRIMIS
jgi:hypothetical protein